MDLRLQHIAPLLFFLLLALASRERKGSRPNEPVQSVFTAAEDVTAAVQALLPAPHNQQVKEAGKWYDATGENWLVLYQTGPYMAANGTQSSDITAVLYGKTDSGFRETWRLRETVTGCRQTASAVFMDGHLQIADSDSNAVAEVFIVYTYGCGEQGMRHKKMVCYEGGSVTTLRGSADAMFADPGNAPETDAAFLQREPRVQTAIQQHWDRLTVRK